MYDIRDVLRKGIAIANKKKAMYLKAQEDSGDIRVRMVLGVFIKAADKDIEYYEKLISNVSDQMAEFIDFGVFDKISSLVNQFSRTIMMPHMSDRKEFILFAKRQEQAEYALAVDIQGRLVTNETVVDTIAYYVLTEIIEEKRKFIDEIDNLLN